MATGFEPVTFTPKHQDPIRLSKVDLVDSETSGNASCCRRPRHKTILIWASLTRITQKTTNSCVIIASVMQNEQPSFNSRTNLTHQFPNEPGIRIRRM